MAQRTPLAIGDRVQYSAEWLRSTGQYTGEICFARGRITEFVPLGNNRLATVVWENFPDGPHRVLASNLSRIH